MADEEQCLGIHFIFLSKCLQRGQIMLGSLGNEPLQDSAAFTCPVNGLRVENALERSSMPTGAWTFPRGAVGRQFLSPGSQMDSAP